MNDTKRSVALGVSLAGLGLLAFVGMGVDTRRATLPASPEKALEISATVETRTSNWCLGS